MYTGLKHLHILLTSLFVLTMLIKAILLIANEDKFDAYRKKTKVPEMIVTMLFLITGIIMMVIRGFGFHHFLWDKLGLVIIAIPLGIVGFKKKNKILAMLSALLFVITIGMALKSGNNVKQVKVEVAEDKAGSLEHGKLLYEANCATCHGEIGASEIGGAKNLTSGYDAVAVSNIVQSGIGKMPAFTKLDSVETMAIGKFVETLKAQP